MRATPVGVVIADESMPSERVHDHHRQLLRLLRADTRHWAHIGSVESVRFGRHHRKQVHLFRQIGHEDLPKRALTLEDARPP